MNSKQANAIPLEELLGRYGQEPARRYGGYLMYSSPFRRDSTPSFRVDLNTNKWKDFGEDSSGGVVDLVMRLEGCDFSSAMRRLERGEFSASLPEASLQAIPKDTTVSSSLVIDNVNPLSNRRLLEYMKQRCIDPDIAKAYCKEVYYHFSNKAGTCFAVGFPNDCAGMELRNPIFKGCAGMKAVTCFDNGSDRCAVFEGFMDYLSYLQYAREHTRLPPMDFCVLNSTSMADRSKEFLGKHRIVHAFLDNDNSGRDALARLRRMLPEKTILVNESDRLFPKHNDFNEFLQACKKKAVAAGNEM